MFSRPRQGEERLTIALSCYPSFIDLAHGGHRPPRSGGRLIILNSAEGMGFPMSQGSLPRYVGSTFVSLLPRQVCPVVIVLPGSFGYKKSPAGSGAFFIQSEAGASRRLSTCRPCRPCHPCRQAWQERPSWVRAFRRWRIRWSAAGRPRKRRSTGRYGSPSWGR